ncbi:MAG: hypothetical protein WCL07_02310 [bacterium]
MGKENDDIVVTPVPEDSDINDALNNAPLFLGEVEETHVEPYESWEFFPDELFPEGFFSGLKRVDDPGMFDQGKIDDVVNIVHDGDYEAWQQSQESNAIEFSDDEILRLYVDLAQRNVDAAQFFFRNFRSNALGMIKRNRGDMAEPAYTTNEGILSGEGMNMTDIVDMVADWGLPLAIRQRQEAWHYVLVLDKPIQTEGKWRVLVYDPMLGNESWDDLPDEYGIITDPDNPGSFHTATVGIFTNQEGWKRWKNNNYEYDIRGDEELASWGPNIPRAKRTAVQMRGYDCGIACIYMALLRAGAKGNVNAINSMGNRAQIYKDTGVIYQLRDELIGDRITPQADDLMNYSAEDDINF